MRCQRLVRWVIGVCCAGSAVASARAKDPVYPERWVWMMTNLLVDEQADLVTRLIERSAKAGFNGVALADYKFNLLEQMPDRYFKNVARVRAAAEANRVELIPCLFPVGRSDGLLMHDPNLAEGMPVINSPYVVRNGEATLLADSGAQIKNGGFEETSGDRFVGFGYQDEPGQVTFADHEIAHSGQTSCRMQDIGKGSGNGRVIQQLKLRPHAAYRLSCWVKSRDLRPPAVTLLANAKRPLTHHELHVQPTQDWTLAEVVFNTLDSADVSVYAGQWGGGSGSLWIDDMQCEELSLVNVLRRDGCPLVVAGASGGPAFAEGQDFEPVVDPQLGRTPFAGQYHFGHPGAKLRLTGQSRIKEGDRLAISWYHPVVIHSEEVACCLTEPKVYELLEDQARRVNELLKPKTFFMQHDELRMANWCGRCQATGKTPGELLADNARRCGEILRRVNPSARVVVWSDMFDPHHNAVDNSYLVNGSLKGSWEGLTPEVIIANWNGGKPEQSLKFFADRGHRQVIAGYYDAPVGDFARWRAAGAAMGTGPHGRDWRPVIGVMYTTWQANYADLESFAKTIAER